MSQSNVCNDSPKKILRKDIWLHANFNPACDGFLIEKSIFLTHRTTVYISVYQNEHQAFFRDATSNIIVLPCKHIDYKIYIWEEVNGSIRDFCGTKQMNFNSYITSQLCRISANVLLTNDCEENADYSGYELDLRILISEPFGSTCVSKFVFT